MKYDKCVWGSRGKVKTFAESPVGVAIHLRDTDSSMIAPVHPKKDKIQNCLSFN